MRSIRDPRRLGKFPAILAAALASALAFAAAPPAPVGAGGGFHVDCPPVLRPPDPRTAKGPRYAVKSDPGVPGKTRLADRPSLKIVSYNVLNLEESPGKYVKIDGKEVFRYGKITKPKHQIDAVLRNIAAEKPDIIVGIEIESLNAMNVLGDEYFKILVPGNDDRINIGFLVRKNLAVDIEIQSHRELKHDYLGKRSPLFSRDFPVLAFRNAGDPETADPVFVLGGVHLKSQRGESIDAGSRLKRTEQAAAMTEILRDYYGDRVPVFVCGDFNANVVTAPEFAKLKESGYRDAFDLMGYPPNSPKRVTHLYFPPEGGMVRQQLDAFFASSAGAKKVVDARVMVNYGPNGKPLPEVTSFEQREATRGSDHDGIAVTIDLSKK